MPKHLFWHKFNHAHTIIGVLALDFWQIIRCGTAFCVSARDAFNVLVRHRFKNLYLHGGVGLSALGAFDPCKKLAFWAVGLVSHDCLFKVVEFVK